MGRSKIYRQNLKALIKSISTKTLYQWLVEQTRTRFGVALQEAELIAEKAEFFLIKVWETSLGNQFVFHLHSGNSNHQKNSLSHISSAPVQLTAYKNDDLDILMKLGLKAMQNSRICRLIEEAYFQNAIFSYKQLCMLSNITAKSIRQRLIPLWEKGIRLPILSTAKKYRKFYYFRSTFVLRQYFDGQPLHELQKSFFFGNSQWEQWVREFLLTTCSNSSAKCMNLLHFPDELAHEYSNLFNDIKDTATFKAFYNSFQHLIPVHGLHGLSADEQLFLYDLEYNHRFSKAKCKMYMQMLSELKEQLSQLNRPDNSIIYFATSDREPPGKPLSFSQMKPAILSWWTNEDLKISSLDSTESLKWQKILRFSTEAHNQGSCLNQSDLSFLLGIHPGVIQKLIKEHDNIALPLRGNVADMGPGLSHAEKIIELFLQGYTETEILRRTGHSYASIERYLLMFSRVVALMDRKMPLPLIRQAIGCSMKLVEKYSQIYDKYNTPDYQFTLMQIRRIFDKNNNTAKKNSFPLQRRSIWDD